VKRVESPRLEEVQARIALAADTTGGTVELMEAETNKVCIYYQHHVGQDLHFYIAPDYLSFSKAIYPFFVALGDDRRYVRIVVSREGIWGRPWRAFITADDDLSGAMASHVRASNRLISMPEFVPR